MGTGLGWICLGSYLFLSRNGYLSHPLGWIPVVSFSFSIFISCWGIIPLPYVVISELLPDNVRNFISMVCALTMWSSAFVLIKVEILFNFYFSTFFNFSLNHFRFGILFFKVSALVSFHLNPLWCDVFFRKLLLCRCYNNRLLSTGN